MKIEKLYPACKSIIWGGDKLKKHYGKQTDADPLAETWELSFHKDGQSRLSDGTPLSAVATEEVAGLLSSFAISEGVLPVNVWESKELFDKFCIKLEEYGIQRYWDENNLEAGYARVKKLKTFA